MDLVKSYVTRCNYCKDWFKKCFIAKDGNKSTNICDACYQLKKLKILCLSCYTYVDFLVTYQGYEGDEYACDRCISGMGRH